MALCVRFEAVCSPRSNSQHGQQRGRRTVMGQFWRLLITDWRMRLRLGLVEGKARFRLACSSLRLKPNDIAGAADQSCDLVGKAPAGPRRVLAGTATERRSRSPRQRCGHDLAPHRLHAAGSRDRRASSPPRAAGRAGANPRCQRADAAALFRDPSCLGHRRPLMGKLAYQVRSSFGHVARRCQ